MTAADLLALADRVEREPASRLLDVEIGALVKEGAPIARHRLPRDTGPKWQPLESVWPRYTISLDAAVTLYKAKPAIISTDPRKVVADALRAIAGGHGG